MDIAAYLRDPEDPQTIVGTWWIAPVWTGREKQVAERLLDSGIMFYLPITQVRKRDAAGKSRVVDRVQIPSYIFACCADSKQLYDVQDARYVRRREIIEIIPRSQKRLKSELHYLWVAQTNGAKIEPWSGISIDGTYRVIDGPYRGMVGMVERIGSNHLIQLRVSEISYSHALEIEPDNLELVSGA